MSPLLIRPMAASRAVPSSVIFPTSSVRCATDTATPVSDALVFVLRKEELVGGGRGSGHVVTVLLLKIRPL
jgi:hypothetical protein